MKRKTYRLLTVSLLFCLSSTSSSLADDSQVLLTKAVEKLIVDVHELKLKVAELESELKSRRAGRFKERRKQIQIQIQRQRQSNLNCSFRVIRGKVQESKKTCLIASVKKLTEKGIKWVFSVLPSDAPVYVKRWKNWCLLLTLPEYCQLVKEKVKDAVVVNVSVHNNPTDDSVK